MAQAYGCLRKGGTAVVVGVAQPANMTIVRTSSLVFEEKTLKGSYYGSTRPRGRLPAAGGPLPGRAPEARRAGHAPLPIDEAPQAFDDMAQGRNARGVIVFD